jgi:hypothetical protein
MTRTVYPSPTGSPATYGIAMHWVVKFPDGSGGSAKAGVKVWQRSDKVNSTVACVAREVTSQICNEEVISTETTNLDEGKVCQGQDPQQTPTETATATPTAVPPCKGVGFLDTWLDD